MSGKHADVWVHIDRHTTVRHHTCTQYSSTTYLSLHILRVTLQCKGISPYVQHTVPVAGSAVCTHPPEWGVRTPAYTARYDEEAVPSGGGAPMYIEGGCPGTYTLHLHT